MKIVVTGSSGFIGSALCERLREQHSVVGFDNLKGLEDMNIIQEHVDLCDHPRIDELCRRHTPDAVIHCAGIVHQRIGQVDSGTYRKVNCEATEHLAHASAKANPNVRFIFLSTVSVYGEKHAHQPIEEESPFLPTSDYAASKLAAETRLHELFVTGAVRMLDILRLAPVYDRHWTFNLNRRILGPGNAFYVRYGSGRQRMSGLARPNLVAFIDYLLKLEGEAGRENVYNVCDRGPYGFRKITQVFSESGLFPCRRTIPVPLPVVWLGSRLGGLIFKRNRIWFHACYDKLARDQVFSANKMLDTGFLPEHSIETIFHR